MAIDSLLKKRDIGEVIGPDLKEFWIKWDKMG